MTADNRKDGELYSTEVGTEIFKGFFLLQEKKKKKSAVTKVLIYCIHKVSFII